MTKKELHPSLENKINTEVIVLKPKNPISEQVDLHPTKVFFIDQQAVVNAQAEFSLKIQDTQDKNPNSLNFDSNELSAGLKRVLGAPISVSPFKNKFIDVPTANAGLIKVLEKNGFFIRISTPDRQNVEQINSIDFSGFAIFGVAENIPLTSSFDTKSFATIAYENKSTFQTAVSTLIYFLRSTSSTHMGPILIESKNHGGTAAHSLKNIEKNHQKVVSGNESPIDSVINLISSKKTGNFNYGTPSLEAYFAFSQVYGYPVVISEVNKKLRFTALSINENNTLPNLDYKILSIMFHEKNKYPDTIDASKLAADLSNSYLAELGIGPYQVVKSLARIEALLRAFQVLDRLNPKRTLSFAVNAIPISSTKSY